MRNVQNFSALRLLEIANSEANYINISPTVYRIVRAFTAQTLFDVFYIICVKFPDG